MSRCNTGGKALPAGRWNKSSRVRADFMRLHEIAEQPFLIKQQLAGCSVFTRCSVLPKFSYLEDKSPDFLFRSSLPACASLLQCCVSHRHDESYQSSQKCVHILKSHENLVLLILRLLYRVQHSNSSFCTEQPPVKQEVNLDSKKQDPSCLHIFEIEVIGVATNDGK